MDKDLIEILLDKIIDLTKRAVLAEKERDEYKGLWEYKSDKCEDLNKRIAELEAAVANAYGEDRD